MRREKSLRIGVHHADAVVWGPVYRTHLTSASRVHDTSTASQHRAGSHFHTFMYLSIRSVRAGGVAVGETRRAGVERKAFAGRREKDARGREGNAAGQSP
jgi:hypothetical protein